MKCLMNLCEVYNARSDLKHPFAWTCKCDIAIIEIDFNPRSYTSKSIYIFLYVDTIRYSYKYFFKSIQDS